MRRGTHPIDSHPPLRVRLEATGLGLRDALAQARNASPLNPASNVLDAPDEEEERLSGFSGADAERARRRELAVRDGGWLTLFVTAALDTEVSVSAHSTEGSAHDLMERPAAQVPEACVDLLLV